MLHTIGGSNFSMRQPGPKCVMPMNEFLSIWYQRSLNCDRLSGRFARVFANGLAGYLANIWQESGKPEEFDVSLSDIIKDAGIGNEHRNILNILETFQSLEILTFLPKNGKRVRGYTITILFEYPKIVPFKATIPCEEVQEGEKIVPFKATILDYTSDGDIIVMEIVPFKATIPEMGIPEVLQIVPFKATISETGNGENSIVPFKATIFSMDSPNSPALLEIVPFKATILKGQNFKELETNDLEIYPNSKRKFRPYIFIYNIINKSNNIIYKYNKPINSKEEEFYAYIELFKRMSGKDTVVSVDLKKTFEKFRLSGAYTLDKMARALENFMRHKYWRYEQYHNLNAFFILRAKMMEQLLGCISANNPDPSQPSLFDEGKKVTEMSPEEQQNDHENDFIQSAGIKRTNS